MKKHIVHSFNSYRTEFSCHFRTDAFQDGRRFLLCDDLVHLSHYSPPNISCLRRWPVGVPARPPRPVSRSAEGIVRPILYIASTTSSAGILDSMPASAMSAAVRALLAPAALRFTHGTSTRPATGSQTRPSIFLSAMAKPCALIAGVPPAISTRAAAAIALALPTSAWQPPAAPEMFALFATTKPNAPEVNRNLIMSSRDTPCFSFMANNTPGTTPPHPAAVAAQTSPIAAFTSLVLPAWAIA